MISPRHGQGFVAFASCSFVLAAHAAAQTMPTPDQPPEGIPAPAAVLKESYDASAALFPEERAFLLGFLADAAAAIDPPQAAAWAKEGLRLAQRLPAEWNTLALEKNLLTALAAADAPEAMRGLCLLDGPPKMDDGSIPEDPRAYSTRRIFPAFWSQTGYRGFDEIRRVSQCLAANGQFPFAGVSPIVATLHKGHPDDALSLYFLATNYIPARPDIEGASAEIVDFLLARRGEIPGNLLTPAFRAVVKRLEAQAAAPPRASLNFSSVLSAGKNKLSFDNEAEMLLARVLPDLERLDSALAKKVIEEYPKLAAAGGGQPGKARADSVVVEGQADPATLQAFQTQGLEYGRLAEVQRLAATDPGAAVSLASTITTPDIHVQAIAIAAAAMNSSDPSAAGKLLDSSLDGLLAIQDVSRRIEASLPALRALAARSDMSAFGHLYRQLLSVGMEAWKADMQAHPVRAPFLSGLYDPLSSLTRLGASLDPPATLAQVRKLDASARCYLLVPAAQGLADASASASAH